ncbi:MAG: hypothetical protein NPIRA04_17630 [Nitrospirales bacterium]|nr:MAG: hypothetical protein NPIRA04_17630 [Nitrospirales bacterium]
MPELVKDHASPVVRNGFFAKQDTLNPTIVTPKSVPIQKRWELAKFRAMLKLVLAYLCYPFWGAERVGHWFGIVPYLPVSGLQFIDQTFTPPERFDYARCHGGGDENFWDRPTPSHVTLNHTLLIPEGSADQDGFVFGRNSRPVLEACHPFRQRMKYRRRRWRDSVPVAYRTRHPRPRYFSGRIAVLTSQNQHQYSHWLFDVLPRLAKVQEFYGKTDYYFLQYSHPFQVETINQLGCISESQIVNSMQIPWVCGDELVVPCHQIFFGYHFPWWVCKWLRETFLPMQDVCLKPKRKIYVSRVLAERRLVTNERELVDFLCQQGFEIYVLEEFSFVEQVALFQDAEVIVAPHGSGLANLVFCDPGTHVIELFPARATDAYFRLSVDMDLKYTCIKTRDIISHPRVSDNFSICVEDVRDALSQD